MSLLIWSIVALASLIALVIGAETAVKNVLALLNHFGYSKTFGGLTFFALATSLPEISAHFVSSVKILLEPENIVQYEHLSGTVLGSNIGSDVIQQTFVLGLVVLLTGGFVFKKDFLKTAYLPMIGTTLMCIILGIDGTYSRIDGLILVGTFIAYMYFLYKREKSTPCTQEPEKCSVWKNVALSILSFIIVLFSAHYLLEAVEVITAITGLGGSFIGVITLGVASAAPEMLTALSGIRHKATGISLGTLIGSNITNPLVAIGGGALISTYWVPQALVYWDLPMETITAALLLIYLWFNGGKLGKKGGVYLIALYFFYLIIRFAYFSKDLPLA